MKNISYFQICSVNSKNSRGGLLNRWEKAEQNNFNFVEIPAHFVRDTETEFLGLSAGEFLTKETINKLYSKDDKLPSGIKYIFHTEPALAAKCFLKWYSEPGVEMSDAQRLGPSLVAK